MMGRRLNYVFAAAVLAAPAVASAHIHLTSPLSHTDQPTGEQKEEHCGTLNYVRADHLDRVTTLLPGATVTVTWDETIPHPGWYRISFQQDGMTFYVPVPENGPDGNGNPGVYPVTDMTGMTEPTSGSLILADRIGDLAGTTTYSMDVTLPNIECANCTLQLIQMMTDKPPYTNDALSDDIYFNCADITLSATAPDAAPAGTPDASPGNPGGGDAAGGGGGGATGGCSTSGGSSGILVALGLGALLVRRRRSA